MKNGWQLLEQEILYGPVFNIKGNTPSIVEDDFSDSDPLISDPWIKLYRAKEGVIDRCGILYWDPNIMFIGSKVHFYGRKYFVCKRGSCCSASKAM